MPPAKKFQKDDIINAAYEIVRMEGFGGLNARRVARELSSSVQPIFHNFASMEDLKAAVLEKIYQTYKGYIYSRIDEKEGYKQTGMSYVRFARDFPEFFKILFMNQDGASAECFKILDKTNKRVIRSGQKMTGFSYEEQEKFHMRVWIFTHGIATLVATKTVTITDEEVDELLQTTVREMVKGHMLESGCKVNC